MSPWRPGDTSGRTWQAAVPPVLLPDIALVLGPPPPHVQGGANIVPGLAAGAHYVVHCRPPEACAPLLQPAAADGGDELQGAGLAVLTH